MNKEYRSVREFALSKSDRLSKRAKFVINSIAELGAITSEYIASKGYEHAPRAVRDVRDAGIPIKTSFVKSSKNGRKIASYSFGEISEIKDFMSDGRKTFSKKFKKRLLNKQNYTCAICGAKFDGKLLQIDHRIPYSFMGDNYDLEPDIDDFMLLCASCNRKKDQATKDCCEKTCFKSKNLKIIKSCYWASPENYTHICMKEIRRADLTFFGKSDIDLFDKLKNRSKKEEENLSDYIKKILYESMD